MHIHKLWKKKKYPTGLSARIKHICAKTLGAVSSRWYSEVLPICIRSLNTSIRMPPVCFVFRSFCPCSCVDHTSRFGQFMYDRLIVMQWHSSHGLVLAWPLELNWYCRSPPEKKKKKGRQAGNQSSNLCPLPPHSSHTTKKPPPCYTRQVLVCLNVFSCDGGGGSFLACEDFGGRFDELFLACTFLFFSFLSFVFLFFVLFNFFFKWRSARAHQFHVFCVCPGSVHSGSSSWDDCGRLFPDE